MDPLQQAIDELKSDLFLIRNYSHAIEKSDPQTKKKLLRRLVEYGKLFHDAAVEAIKNGERCEFYERVYFALGAGEVNLAALPLDFVKEALYPVGEFTGTTWSQEHAA